MPTAVIKIAGNTPTDVIEVDAIIVGALAIHRPAYRYMPGTPVTYGTRGWNVTHISTGGSLTRYAPKDTAWGRVTLKRLKEWARVAQGIDGAAWDALNALPFGHRRSNPELGRRVLSALQSA